METYGPSQRKNAADDERARVTVSHKPPVTTGGQLTEELLEADSWTEAMVRAAGIPIVQVPLVSIGGGIGSFITVDYLRIAGVAPERIRVLSNLDFPWQTYEYLTRVSQIPRGERIRSDSSSRPDNIWGFPSYALAEAVRDRSLRPLWQVLVEPIWDDYYTPRAGQMFTGLEREAKRIGYQQMVVQGQVQMVRRCRGGGYFTILTPPSGDAQRKEWLISLSSCTLAVGYPGLRFLPELQEFRTEQRDCSITPSPFPQPHHPPTRESSANLSPH